MVMRGRVLFGNDSRLRRRAASVPAEHLRHHSDDDIPEVGTRHQIYGIASRAAQDADDLTAKSRRHDRDFLRDVSAKLNAANGPAPYLQPSLLYSAPITTYHSTPSYYPPKTTVHTAPRHVADSRRRTWGAPLSSQPVSDYEVNSYLEAAPCRPYIRSSVVTRAGSVPPVLPSRATAPRWYPSTPVSSQVLGYRPSYRWTPTGDGRKPGMEDIVVGVAHTSLYGDIVIGIPYNKRFMFNVQHGMDEVQDNGVPRIPLNLGTRVTSSPGGRPSTDHHRFANTVYRPLTNYVPYSSNTSTVRPHVITRRASYSGPSYVSGRPHHYVAPYYADTSDDSDLLSTNYTTYGRKPKILPLTGKVYSDDLDDDYLYTKSRPVISASTLHSLRPVGRSSSEPFSNLRTMTRVAQDKTKEHGSLLDRYLPNPVYVAPYNPAPLSNALVSTTNGPSVHVTNVYGKPPISETRQRVRELLCKSRKDPHYFD